MDALITAFKAAYDDSNGYALAGLLDPEAPGESGHRYGFHRSSSSMAIQNDLRSALLYHDKLHLSKEEATAWIEIFTAYWHATGKLSLSEQAAERQRGTAPDWTSTYKAWRTLTTTLQKYFQRSVLPYWSVPCMYVATAYLRVLAMKADESARANTGTTAFSTTFRDDDVVSEVGKQENLQDAARIMNMVFAAFASDRAPLEESRKWGLYSVANLQFKIYFQLNAINLAKNLIASVSVADLPALEYYPLAHRVTFHYYCGVVSFLEEDYAKAEEHLKYAWEHRSPDSPKNQELVLTYLVPCHLLTTHQLPRPELLAPFPQLASLFAPLASAIKHASLAEFEAALQAGEAYFVKRRIYLTLERARDIVLRNLFRKVYLAGGYEPMKEGQLESQRTRRTRVKVDEFVAAVRISSAGSDSDEKLERDEVECLLANMIYKNLIKGYIHRDLAIVVLSKKGPFPGTTDT